MQLWSIPRTGLKLQLPYPAGFTIDQLVLWLAVGNKITYICLICGQPIQVGLSYPIQPCSRVAWGINPYDDRLASLRNPVFPASNFCKHTRAVNSHVIFLAIIRSRTVGLKISFVRNDISGELLSGSSVVLFPPFKRGELTTLLANPAPVSTMYTVCPAPAVLSYTKSAPSLV